MLQTSRRKLLCKKFADWFRVANERVVDGRCPHTKHGPEEEDAERQRLLPLLRYVLSIIYAQKDACHRSCHRTKTNQIIFDYNNIRINIKLDLNKPQV